MRRGEFDVKWKLFLPNAVNHTEFLFQLPVPSNYSMKDTKEEIVRHFNELQKSDETKRKTEPFSLGKPENLRIREIFFQAPSNVLCDSQLIREIFASKNALSGVPELLVQMLPEGQSETKTSNDQVFFFLQQFHPDKFELGQRFEFEVRDSEKLSSFVQRIKQHTGINSLAISVCDHWDDPKLLEAKWTEIIESDKPQSHVSKLVYAPDRTVLSWRISDGDLFLFKDSSVPPKTLTDEDKQKLKEDEDKRKKQRMVSRNSYSSREESLVIKQKDVGLDDI